MLDRFKAQLNLLSVLHVFGVVPPDMNMQKYKNTVKKQTVHGTMNSFLHYSYYKAFHTKQTVHLFGVKVNFK